MFFSYSGKIENAEELLDEFLETFLEEPPVVQHQLLTAIVKLALLPDRESVDILQRVEEKIPQRKH